MYNIAWDENILLSLMLIALPSSMSVAASESHQFFPRLTYLVHTVTLVHLNSTGRQPQLLRWSNIYSQFYAFFTFYWIYVPFESLSIFIFLKIHKRKCMWKAINANDFYIYLKTYSRKKFYFLQAIKCIYFGTLACSNSTRINSDGQDDKLLPKPRVWKLFVHCRSRLHNLFSQARLYATEFKIYFMHKMLKSVRQCCCCSSQEKI